MIDFIPILEDLISKRHITQKQLLIDLNLSQNVFTKWRSGITPSTEVLCKLADYFEVTTDYLLGRNTDLSSTEREMINSFRKLSSDYQYIINTNIKMFSELKEKNNDDK